MLTFLIHEAVRWHALRWRFSDLFNEEMLRNLGCRGYWQK